MIKLSKQPRLREGEFVVPVTAQEARALAEMLGTGKRVETSVRASVNRRSLAWNDYYWGHLVAQPVAYCNARMWNGRPLFFVNGEAREVTKDDIHNFHLGFLGQQEQIYGLLGNEPVRSYRSTRNLVHESKHRALTMQEVSTDFFQETIIAAWGKISEEELKLLPPGGVDRENMVEMANMYT